MDWEAAKYKSYIFPIKVQSSEFDIQRVHPIMQRRALDVHNALKGDPRVLGVILFGGATNIRCHFDSDMDMLVALHPEHIDRDTKNEVSEIIQEACGWNADILWDDQTEHSGQLYEHIKKGVQIV